MNKRLAEANSKIDRLSEILKKNAGNSRSPAGVTNPGQGNIPLDRLVNHLPSQVGDLGAQRAGYYSPDLKESTGLGTFVPENNSVEILKIIKDGSQHPVLKFDENDNLTLVSNDKTYAIKLENVKLEKGKVVSFDLAGKTYNQLNFKDLGIGEDTLLKLNKLATTKQLKNFGETMEFALAKEKSENKKPTPQFYTYTNLKCITLAESEELKENNPELFKNCPK